MGVALKNNIPRESIFLGFFNTNSMLSDSELLNSCNS
jgi:hypothetical protein